MEIIEYSPKEEWKDLKKYILKQIKVIDGRTSYQNTEPEWWIEMQNIAKEIRDSKE